VTLHLPADGGARLRLLAVHLNAGCREGALDRPDVECEALARHSEILAGWIAARRREGTPFAILGDFNRRMTGTSDDLLRALAGLGTTLVRATEGVSDPCWAGARGGRPFVDHILLGGGAERWWPRDSLRVLVYPSGTRPPSATGCPTIARSASACGCPERAGAGVPAA
jgi:endonuclease/exonuclease/phosphatase family metal-dependent hydrolase